MGNNSFTVGKLDAGMAILIGERASLIEFPSILLPPGVQTGSIVDIAVNRNSPAEKEHAQSFWDLQRTILDTYGIDSPKSPRLRVRNTTQTSVVLEWDSLQLATSKLRSLDIYRNGQRLSNITNPLSNASFKSSGLSLSTDYTFQLILRTTAGTYPSEVIKVKTHSINDTTGISVCIGAITDNELLESSKSAIEEMGAKSTDKVTIDTTHFVCNKPGPYNLGEYQKAVQLSIPIVQPQWLLACHGEHRMVNISSFYLGGPMPSVKFESRSTNNVTQSSDDQKSEQISATTANEELEQQEHENKSHQIVEGPDTPDEPEGGAVEGIPEIKEGDKIAKDEVRKEIEQAEREATEAAYGHEAEDVAGREGRDDMKTFKYPRVTAVPEDEVRPTSPTPPQLTITDANGREEVLAEGVGDFDYGNQDGEEIDLNDNDSNSSDDDRE